MLHVEHRLAMAGHVHRRADRAVEIRDEGEELAGEEALKPRDADSLTLVVHADEHALVIVHRLVHAGVEVDAAREVVAGDEVRTVVLHAGQRFLNDLGIVADTLDEHDGEAVLLRDRFPDQLPAILGDIRAVQNRNLSSPIEEPHHVVHRAPQDLHAQRVRVRVVRVVPVRTLLLPKLLLAHARQAEDPRAVVDPSQIPGHFPRDVRLAPAGHADHDDHELAALCVAGVQQVGALGVVGVLAEPVPLALCADVGPFRVQQAAGHLSSGAHVQLGLQARVEHHVPASEGVLPPSPHQENQADAHDAGCGDEHGLAIHLDKAVLETQDASLLLSTRQPRPPAPKSFTPAAPKPSARLWGVAVAGRVEEDLPAEQFPWLSLNKAGWTGRSSGHLSRMWCNFLLRKRPRPAPGTSALRCKVRRGLAWRS
mmetsp:Transcript_7773/g.29152  ORF Transcript_7773/g.29152 Transcript_7773/m.29152 type:complete len:425 (-) Transcript_7773:13-1287(-)